MRVLRAPYNGHTKVSTPILKHLGGTLYEKAEETSRYRNETKLEAIRRVLEENEPVQVVCDSLGIRHRDNVYEWIKKYKKQGGVAFDRSIGRPKKEELLQSTDDKVKNLRMEIDALKKHLKILHQGGLKKSIKVFLVCVE